MAFSKKRIEDRKQWLCEFQKGSFMDFSKGNVTYTEFVDKELILFSRDDNLRSIPSMVDGLKPGQRKVATADAYISE
jgi:DNA topoisomerase-2